MSENQNKSLLKCTLRKSADVFAKLVLYASYVVCGVTALGLGLWLVLGPYETKVFLFLGACLHYRKRMKEEKK